MRIPKANLAYGTLTEVNLSGADLREVNLSRVLLNGADLTDANLTDVFFGEYPSLQLENKVHCVAYNPVGRQMAVGTGFIIVLYTEQVKGVYEKRGECKGHTHYVTSVVFSPDGSCLASSSFDHTVRLWDTLSLQSQGELGAYEYCYECGL